MIDAQLKALQVRMYGEKVGDYQTVSSWWEARHGAPLPETILPPLGVIVEDHIGPRAALWCYECYGIGVCFLEFAVTKPRTSRLLAAKAFCMATEACIRIAKTHGDFSYFRCITTQSIAPAMKALGFLLADGDFKQLAMRRD